MKRIFLSLITLFFATSFISGQTISGKLDNGLRVIDVKSGGNINLTVYRGDYIVINTPESKTMEFEIPALNIKESLPLKGQERAYIKIKESGSFQFTLGSQKGTLTVLELTSPRYKELTAKDAQELIDNIDPFILDVRTEREYNSGHIPNAELLPVQDLYRSTKSIDMYKNEPVFVYCQSGNRSTVASRILLDAGFTNIYNLRYGIGDWKAKGFEITR